MSSTNNIKDALIRNNTMIANELKTNFAKKDEVSELATDKVDKSITTPSASGSDTGKVINKATGPSLMHTSTSNTTGNYNERVDIGSAEATIDNHGVSLTADHGIANSNSLILKYDGINIKNAKNAIVKTYDVLNDLDIVEALPNAIIPSQTITFGTNGNYESLLDLSGWTKGTSGNYDYKDNNNDTTFKNKTLSFNLKKGGTFVITGKLNAILSVGSSTITCADTGSTSRNIAFSGDAIVTIAFTNSNSNISQIIAPNFVNKYVLETELNNYYTKSEVDTAISGIGGVSLSGYNIFTGHNTFTNGYFDVTYPKVTDEDYHEIYAVTNSEDDANRIMLEVGTEGINNNIAQFELSNDDHDLYTAWTLDGSRRTGGTSDIGMYMSESGGSLSDAMFKLWTNPRHISDIFSTTMTADYTGFELTEYVEDDKVYNNSLAINHDFDVTVSATEDGDTDSSNINLSSTAFIITAGANKFRVSDSGVPQFSSDGGTTWRDISLVNL